MMARQNASGLVEIARETRKTAINVRGHPSTARNDEHPLRLPAVLVGDDLRCFPRAHPGAKQNGFGLDVREGR